MKQMVIQITIYRRPIDSNSLRAISQKVLVMFNRQNRGIDNDDNYKSTQNKQHKIMIVYFLCHLFLNWILK